MKGIRLCECGCGELVTRPGFAFIHNHHLKIKEPLKDKDGFPLCACGCGEPVTKIKNKYIRGHNGKGKHYHLGQSAWNKGLTKETNLILAEMAKKISASVVELHKDSEYREAYEKGREKIENFTPWNKGLTKETSEKVARNAEATRHAIKWLYENNEEYRSRVTEAVSNPKTAAKKSKTMKKKFFDPKFCRKWAKSHSILPNKLELRVGKILQDLFPDEYKYVGNFDTFIGGKCPDFINVNGQKKLIEVFGNYWHEGNNPEDRINHFKRYGFDTLVLWEKDIMESPTKVQEVLIDFHSDGGEAG